MNTPSRDEAVAALGALSQAPGIPQSYVQTVRGYVLAQPQALSSAQVALVLAEISNDLHLASCCMSGNRAVEASRAHSYTLKALAVGLRSVS